MRVLLFGGAGQVGLEVRLLAASFGVEVVAPDRSALDIRDAAAVRKIIAAEPWPVVINAAGYTDVDHAEAQRSAAFAVNADAVQIMARETARQDIPLLHLSTDYVFDGRKGAPYIEADTTGPLNAYGESKLEGELLVRAENKQHIILRTSWVYSPHRKNFVKTVMRLAQERDSLAMVSDQTGNPTSATEIARAVLRIAQRLIAQERLQTGTYHFAGAGDATWFEFAAEILAQAAARTGRSVAVQPISTSEYPTAAVRPADSRLDCKAIAEAFGIKAPLWRASLRDTIDRLLCTEAA